jgi:nicotinic acid phosphoribosyltransferase
MPGYMRGQNRDERQKQTAPKTVKPVNSDGGIIKGGETIKEMADTSSEYTFTNQVAPGSVNNARKLECPLSIMTDSYKSTHLLMYNEAKEMRAYGTFRQSYEKSKDDRIVFYGIKYYIRNFILRTMDKSDIDASRKFLNGHLLTPIAKKSLAPEGSELGKGNAYFNEKGTDASGQEIENYLDLFLKNGGRFPVKIEAMPEGSVVRPHIPVYIITASAEYSRLCTFLETILTMVWYPSTVATLSRRIKFLISDAFERTVNRTKCGNTPYDVLLNGRLHDFGFRGCTCVEQSVIGGSAHLLSFNGSDTMSACFYTQVTLNQGKVTGHSLPATEHSVMTSWENEVDAMKNLCEKFPGGLVSCVMDAYDYDDALANGLPQIADIVRQYNCTFVIRPDSGNPVKQVMKALEWGEKAFKSYDNGMGYKVLNNCCVLQGDGIDFSVLKEILDTVIANHYSAQNVAFGMGGGLLQKVNRDTMAFATKLSYVRDMSDREISVLKAPRVNSDEDSEEPVKPSPPNKDASGSGVDEGEQISDKTSLPGKLKVLHKVGKDSAGRPCVAGEHVVYPESVADDLLKTGEYAPSMKVVYDGMNPEFYADLEFQKFRDETFDEVRKRLDYEWTLNGPRVPAVHPTLKRIQVTRIREIRDGIAQRRDAYAQRIGEQSAGRGLHTSFCSSTESVLRMLDKLL